MAVADTPDRLKEIEQTLELKLYSGEHAVDEEHPLSAGDQQLAEIVVTPGSGLEHAALEQARLPERYQLIRLAIHQAGRALKLEGRDLATVRLLAGDVLLVQGPREELAELKRRGDLLVLDATTDLPRTSRASVALALMAAAVAVAALGWLPIAVSATAVVLLMLVTGCLSWNDATRALSASVVLIVVASLALGLALMKTGGADYLARLFVAGAAELPPWA